MLKRHLNFIALPVAILLVVFVVIKFPVNKNTEIGESSSHKILAQLTNSGPIKFGLKDINGQLVSIDSYSNKVVILNLWATWCGPCVEEFPALIELARKVPEIVLLAVSADKDDESVTAFLKAYGKIPQNIRVLRDPDQMVGQLYGTAVLPESYIFMPGKNLLRKVVGSEKWDRPDVIEFFRQIAGEAQRLAH